MCRRKKLDEIKQRKLAELKAVGIPDKYCAEVSRRITAPPPSFTMSGLHWKKNKTERNKTRWIYMCKRQLPLLLYMHIVIVHDNYDNNIIIAIATHVH